MNHLPLLLVPGYQDSGPDHWQTRWHATHPQWRRVRDQDWQTPDLAQWTQVLCRHLADSPTPLHLVAHSFGCLASLSAASTHPEKIASLFLVAPPDPAHFAIPDEALPPPTCPTSLLLSDNDPWLAADRAALLARRWQLTPQHLGSQGHVNADSGHGHWPDGLARLAAHLRGL
ncbi:alpha/beta fold hydrolase [Pseudaeromonas sp. ZJS20]|uniref:RBBP9/YdeN family alpha/beta hydrolase n=1 Tax=Pseudaeromonas aegiceratis TaxID=3153928 RepID=UPI00390C6102